MTDLTQLDKTVFGWINTGLSSSVLDAIMPWVSLLGDSAAVWLWIGLIGLIVAGQITLRSRAGHGREQRLAVMKAVASFCLYAALIYGINAGVYNCLKHVFHRSRPFVEQTVIVRVSPPTGASELPRDGSFPSGHACNAFMVAALLAYRFKRKGYVFYCLATLVALSRVYLGVHYPGDVIAGSALGWSITWLTLSLHPPL